MKAIAIDGPSGVGKSTVAEELARRLNFLHVDTGALYRAVALYVLRKNIPVKLIVKDLKNIKIDIDFYKNKQNVFLNNENVTKFLRDEKVSFLASEISKIMEVRAFLIESQRKLALKYNVVMDGRDIGTVVLPNADLKFFLTARANVRANRRYLELRKKGYKDITYEKVLLSILKRDKSDTERKFSPLFPAFSAKIIDVSDIGVSEVVDIIFNLFKNNITDVKIGK